MVNNSAKSSLSNIMAFMAGIVVGFMVCTGERSATSWALFISIALVSIAFQFSIKD